MIRRLLLTLLIAGAASAQEPVLLRGPYLQSAAPAALTVCWRTDLPGRGTVFFGTSENDLGASFGESDPATDHVVRLSGLTAGTRYYYRVETEGTLLAGGAACTFVTPPVTGSAASVRFWALGDAGTANSGQRAVRDAFAPVYTKRPADLILMLGDNAYPDCTDVRYQAAVFDMYKDYLKQVPLWSCIGNHETYGGVDLDGKYAHDRIFSFPVAGECGGVASGTERYYSWDYGPVHFISLDSMTSSRSAADPMAQWLQADLQANLQPWVVALWHHPPYTKGSHNSDVELELIQMRENILPILENHGVDLVLCGHSHCYERSFLLDGHYGFSPTLTSSHKKGWGSGRQEEGGSYYKAGVGMNPHQGAVYVTAGSSGQTSGGSLNHPAHFVSLNLLGSVVVDVNGPRMDVRFLRETVTPGAEPVFGDSFSIIKGVTPPPQPQLTRGPYLQMAAPAAMTVRWRTDQTGTGRVRFGTAPGVWTGTVTGTGARTDHSVRLTGLSPATRYYYQVETDGLTMASGNNYFFTTAPPPDSTAPVRVWVLGDAGTQSAGQRAVRDAFQPLHAEQPATMMLMLGDNAYGAGRDAEYQGAVFEMYQPLLGQVPLWSCLGNHETYGDQNPDGTYAWDHIFEFPKDGECGGVASGTERYYSWNAGNIHFIALDSMEADRSPGGPMAQWLRNDLQANTRQWTVACWHHPPYTRGSHDSDFEIELIEMRENIVPILESFGVDLVLCGHSHCYERSFLLDGHYGLSDSLQPANLLNSGDGREDSDGAYVKRSTGAAPHQGAVYVVAGSSGQASGGSLDHPAHCVSLSQLGSVVLDFHNDRLDARFLRETSAGAPGPVFDDWFSIIKGGPALPVPATDLIVLAAGQNTAVLHWTDNSLAEDRYEVLLSVDGGPFSLVATLPPNTPGYTLEGLAAGQNCQVKVVASNLAGAAESAPLAFVHDAAAAEAGSLQRWRFLHWGTTSPEGERLLNADPEGDGLNNLMEFALGTPPRIANPAPQTHAGVSENGRLTITFNRQALPEVNYIVEFNSSLNPNTWQPLWSSTGVENVQGPVTVTDPEATVGKRFARLRITAAGP